MPSNANVIINYGPYKSNGIVDFREDRLNGLISYLQEKGHKVIQKNRMKNWNNVELKVNDEHVFKCNIKDLEFGGDGKLDKLVLDAEKSVSNAY